MKIVLRRLSQCNLTAFKYFFDMVTQGIKRKEKTVGRRLIAYHFFLVVRHANAISVDKEVTRLVVNGLAVISPSYSQVSKAAEEVAMLTVFANITVATYTIIVMYFNVAVTAAVTASDNTVAQCLVAKKTCNERIVDSNNSRIMRIVLDVSRGSYCLRKVRTENFGLVVKD
ncbi:uncharacterized protein EV154DRAFT_481878 [Mucor mucedo]|uniref:uncharacterized protein n=1 Tax=Mucor mucedo TaxID=29922 RepID=UPI002220FDF8|nr:uncharacterized protein EV154DRAFT_481878 [Mucor mucedo]KAI7890750.1 hypothetical protein EV154DRAFT_481878 [Mucor mucedo]